MVWKVDWPRLWWTRWPVLCDMCGFQPAPNNFPSNWNSQHGLSQKFSNELRSQGIYGTPWIIDLLNSIIQMRSNFTSRKASCIISIQYNTVIAYPVLVVKTSHMYSSSSRHIMNIHFSISFHRLGQITCFNQRNVSGSCLSQCMILLIPLPVLQSCTNPHWDGASACQSPGVAVMSWAPLQPTSNVVWTKSTSLLFKPFILWSFVIIAKPLLSWLTQTLIKNKPISR